MVSPDVSEQGLVRDIAAIVEAGYTRQVDGIDVLVLPPGYSHAVPDVEKYRDHPNRKKADLTFTDIVSFELYVKRHATTSSLVFLDERGSRKFVAVLDHHEPIVQDAGDPLAGEDLASAGWGQHRATYSPKYTPGWTAWTGFDDSWQDQQSFAEFLEERIAEIADPPGADLFEIIRTLRLKRTLMYSNVTPLANDRVQLVYQEEISTESSVRGELTVPEKFTLVLKPFDGADAVRLDARLRFSGPDSKGVVKFMFRLGEQLGTVLDEEFGKLAEGVAAGTGVMVLKGHAP